MRAEDLLRERGGVPPLRHAAGRPVADAPPGLREWRAGSEPRGAVEHVLAVARRELQMDVALLSEVRDGREIVLWAVGNGRLPEFVAGRLRAAARHVCQRLLDGTIDSIVHDARGRPARARPARGPRATGLGAYIGVPLTGAAARRYVLCCVAREARPDLSDSRRAVPPRARRERPPRRRPRGRRVVTLVTNLRIAHTLGAGPGQAGRRTTRAGAGRAPRARRSGRSRHPRGDRHDSQGAPHAPGRQAHARRQA